MLVLDANILIRAALGSRVLALLRKYAGQVAFHTPDTAFEEAGEKLPEILDRRKVPAGPAMAILGELSCVVQAVGAETYENFKYLSRQRIAHRDEDDGRFLRPRLRWAARFGPRIPTSLAAVSRPGPLIVWSCTWRTPRS
jgi:hypothetical protein